MKQAHNNFFRIIELFALFFLAGCTFKSDKIMRNFDIGLIAVDKVKFEETFKPIVQGFNEQAFYSILEQMDRQLNTSQNVASELKIGKRTVRFKDIYNGDDSTTTLKKKILQEIIEKYLSGKAGSVEERVEIDILQPMLFYASSRYFKDRFYDDLFYNPPIEFTEIFDVVNIEASKPNSLEVEYINPYAPLCKDLEEEGQIYHLILKKKMLLRLTDELSRQKAKLDNEICSSDFLFLEHILQEAVEGRVMLIKQITP